MPPENAPKVGAFHWISMDFMRQRDHLASLYTRHFRMSSDLSVWESGAAEGTRTPDPIITNDVLYQLSYSGLPAGLIAGFVQGG